VFLPGIEATARNYSRHKFLGNEQQPLRIPRGFGDDPGAVGETPVGRIMNVDQLRGGMLWRYPPHLVSLH
jgi:hypothetical protein